MAKTVHGVDADDLPALLKAYEVAEEATDATYHAYRQAENRATTAENQATAARNEHTRAKTISEGLWEAIEEYRRRRPHR